MQAGLIDQLMGPVQEEVLGDPLGGVQPIECAGGAPTPPRSIQEAIQQARSALRTFREARAAALLASGSPLASGSSLQPGSAEASSTPAPVPGPPHGVTGPIRLTIDLPLPSSRNVLLMTPGAVAPGTADPTCVRLMTEGDFPGGVVQIFRSAAGLADGLLEGYDAEFLGMLEDSADGLGAWAVGPPGGGERDMTVAGIVSAATVPSLLKLMDGGYGARPTQPGHMLVLLNPAWTSADSVGQPWQRRLRARAKAVCAPDAWEALYCCKLLRTSRGAMGLLLRSWPHRWALYPLVTDTTEHVGDCLLASASQPSAPRMVELLNGAAPAMRARAKELGLEESPWPWRL